MNDFTLSPDSVRDIEETFEFIAKDNPDAATRFLETLYDTLQLLANRPNLGRLREEFFPSLRSFVKNKHIIFYMPSPEGIAVLRVLHHSRDIKSVMNQQVSKEEATQTEVRSPQPSDASEEE